MRVTQRRMLLVGAVLIALLIFLSTVGMRELRWFRQLSKGDQSAQDGLEREHRIARASLSASAGIGAKNDGERATVISARISGVVSGIYKSIGSEVAAGEPLVQFDDREARLKLESAKNELEAVTLKLRETELAVFSANLKASEENKTPSGKSDQVEEHEAVKAKHAQTRADFDVATARVKQAKQELVLHLIRTPNGGTVSEIRTKVGDHVKSGGPLMIISE